MKTQPVPEIVHEGEFGKRRHHRDAQYFDCMHTKHSLAYSCVRCWSGIEGDDFLCGPCYLDLIERALSKSTE